jgi:hypothetical protein
MFWKKNLLLLSFFSLLVFALAAPVAHAKKGGEYKSIVKHLKTKYQAKKVRIPFMWLARFAVSVARPAGVKSFSVTLFQDLKFSRETLDAEMQTVLRDSFGAEWNPILRVRSRTGEQVYMYMREAGETVKIAVVTIDKQQAAVIRATFKPDKLAEFINNPKIFGVSLNDNNSPPKNNAETEKPEETGAPEEKKKAPKKDSK